MTLVVCCRKDIRPVPTRSTNPRGSVHEYVEDDDDLWLEPADPD